MRPFSYHSVNVADYTGRPVLQPCPRAFVSFRFHISMATFQDFAAPEAMKPTPTLPLARVSFATQIEVCPDHKFGLYRRPTKFPTGSMRRRLPDTRGRLYGVRFNRTLHSQAAALPPLPPPSQRERHAAAPSQLLSRFPQLPSTRTRLVRCVLTRSVNKLDTLTTCNNNSNNHVTTYPTCATRHHVPSTCDEHVSILEQRRHFGISCNVRTSAHAFGTAEGTRYINIRVCPRSPCRERASATGNRSSHGPPRLRPLPSPHCSPHTPFCHNIHSVYSIPFLFPSLLFSPSLPFPSLPYNHLLGFAQWFYASPKLYSFRRPASPSPKAGVFRPSPPLCEQQLKAPPLAAARPARCRAVLAQLNGVRLRHGGGAAAGGADAVGGRAETSTYSPPLIPTTLMAVQSEGSLMSSLAPGAAAAADARAAPAATATAAAAVAAPAAAPLQHTSDLAAAPRPLLLAGNGQLPSDAQPNHPRFLWDD
eukprot:Rhum_TRINITY_DN15119_c3_g1::Rhum_TRINITY_DN15119_c3_g1_i1::g.139456::m.139456